MVDFIDRQTSSPKGPLESAKFIRRQWFISSSVYKLKYDITVVELIPVEKVALEIHFWKSDFRVVENALHFFK